MAVKNKILVIGASGRVGGAVIDELKHDTSIDLVAAVRTEKQKTRFQNLGVSTTHFDFDDLRSIESSVQNVDALLLLTGYTVDMMKHSKRVLDEAKKAGVGHIVHVGASGNDTAEVAHWGWHRMIEAYIEKLGFTFTHLQPEAFMQNIAGFGWLNGSQLVNLIGDSVWSWIDASDVALLAARALREPAKFRDQTWRLGYSKASMSEVAIMLSQALGSKIDISDQEPVDFYETAISNGADPAYMSCVRDQFELNRQHKISNTDMTFNIVDFQNATGRAPKQWEEFIDSELSELKVA